MANDTDTYAETYVNTVGYEIVLDLGIPVSGIELYVYYDLNGSTGSWGPATVLDSDRGIIQYITTSTEFSPAGEYVCHGLYNNTFYGDPVVINVLEPGQREV